MPLTLAPARGSCKLTFKCRFWFRRSGVGLRAMVLAVSPMMPVRGCERSWRMVPRAAVSSEKSSWEVTWKPLSHFFHLLLNVPRSLILNNILQACDTGIRQKEKKNQINLMLQEDIH